MKKLSFEEMACVTGGTDYNLLCPSIGNGICPTSGFNSLEGVEYSLMLLEQVGKYCTYNM